jgi:hypothetical protein
MPVGALKFGNVMAEGTLLPLFKFLSMNGGIVFRNGGPIGWLGEHQERTALSSCEAEIRATSTISKKVVDFRNHCQSISDLGLSVLNATSPIVLYNDNDACIKWSYNMTSQAACNIELHESLVCKWVQDKTLKVLHITGKTIRRISSVKRCGMAHIFWRLHDSFLSHFSDFLSALVLAIHHARQHSSCSVAPTTAQVSLSSGDSLFMGILASSSFFQTVTNISHLLSAVWHLFWRLHGFVPSSLI